MMNARRRTNPEAGYSSLPGRHPLLPRIGRWGAAAGMAASLLLGSHLSTFARGGDDGGGGTGGPPTAPLKTGALYAVGVSHPGGGVWVGHHLWITDRFTDMCKLTLPKTAMAGLRTEAVCDAAQHQAGEPAYDPTHHKFYVTDTRQASPGVWRISYNAEKDTITIGSGYYNVSTDTVLLAPGQLAGLRTTSTAIGPDGNLYVGSIMTGEVKRIKNATGKTQTVDTVGSGAGVRTVLGLAFIGRNLYLAEPAGLSVIHNAPSCTGGCKATLVPGVAAVDTTAVVARGTNTLYFTQVASASSSTSHLVRHASKPPTTANAKPAQVMRLTLSTGKVELYAKAGTVTAAQLHAAGTSPAWAANCTAGSCPFAVSSEDSSGLAVDPLGNLYVGDDPFTGSTRNTGRIWVVAGT